MLATVLTEDLWSAHQESIRPHSVGNGVRTGVGLAGVAAIAVLHSLLFAVAAWGDGAIRQLPHRPDAAGAGANSGRPEGESIERHMIVHLTSEIPLAKPVSPSTAYLLEPALVASTLEITGPDALPLPPLLFEEEGSEAEGSDAEMLARIRLAGIYENQIRARIQRAWTLPADVSANETFACRVLIRQRPDGRIQEVELTSGECDDSLAMRQSLVSAIFTASPLPAPPHQGVFAESFSLLLRSESVRTSRALLSQQQ